MGANTSRPRDGEVQAVLDGVRRVVQGLHAASRETERRVGLTAAQLFVLRRLAESEALSINELAARTYTHQSSASVVVSRLVGRRFVTRRADPTDARRRVLTLTAAGRRALDAAPASTQERLIAAVSAMTPATRRTTARALAGMADAMAVARQATMFFEGGRR